MNKIVGFVISLTAISVSAFAQTTTLSLEDAVNLGLKNSKQLKLAGYKIDEANEKLEQSRKESLPSAKASIGYSHALMLSQDFYLPSSGGERPQMIQLPFDNTMYQGTLSLNQPLFAGNQYRYARQSAELMVQLSNLDAETDKEEVVYNIISAYINYFKLKQNQKILKQNLDDVEQKLTQIKQYEAEGLATKNDVLRFELQKSEMQLSAIELENNRHIVNYNLNLLLGLPENTEIEEQDVSYKLDVTDDIPYYLSLALKDRKEVSELKYQERLSEINIRKVKDTKLPTVGLGGNLYYINPSKKIIPETGTYLAPLIVGLNIGWDISGLYKSKNKISEARIQKKEITERSELMNDKIKSEV
ncbi:MAG: TolC family protein, partial [Bacteroidetes bacterium]|nr:TolC family protein [Bacteroidota bacterium]